MKISIKVLSLLLIVFGTCSCGSKIVVPTKPEMKYEEKAIKIHLKADSQLNLHKGTPHTLSICIYQLKNPNTFNQLADDDDGLYSLLECSLFDASVVGSKRLIIHPSEDKIHVLDRAEGAKYVAIVAGYYLLHKDRMVRFFNIPVLEIKKGWIKQTKTLKQGPLDIELVLGPQQIQ